MIVSHKLGNFILTSLSSARGGGGHVVNMLDFNSDILCSNRSTKMRAGMTPLLIHSVTKHYV